MLALLFDHHAVELLRARPGGGFNIGRPFRVTLEVIFGHQAHNFVVFAFAHLMKFFTVDIHIKVVYAHFASSLSARLRGRLVRLKVLSALWAFNLFGLGFDCVLLSGLFQPRLLA